MAAARFKKGYIPPAEREPQTDAAGQPLHPDADKPIIAHEKKALTKRQQEAKDRRLQKIYDKGGLVGSETPNARRWKAYYLGLGLSRSLAKTAEEIADQRLMERDGFRLDPRSPRRNDQIRAQVRKLREGDADWARWRRTAHHRCEIWSMTFGWQGAADEHDREEMELLRKETIQREIAMRERHLETGQALMLTGAQDYLKVSAKGGVGPTAAIQAVGMGAQLERSALALGMAKGTLQPTTLNGLIAALSQPPETQNGAPSPEAVVVTQVNNETTNVTNNTVNVLASGPLTVDVLRQLDAQSAQQRAQWRQQSGVANASTTGRQWLQQLPPPPPPLDTRPGSPTTATQAEPIEASVREVPNE